ncbi:hypothetical protein [Chitinophaga silvisoli]|uniref:Collagen-like protein n=1 Tax=Chitinophaga silvisoli TaxID=2291814 RepID=A0A3E1NUT8_9BACT|nr:hypothetical protein [Chitinophaga silvisoli]RFM31715.1 hypothetical protein DXN04_26470 [Chitinophaga silvisoli]
MKLFSIVLLLLISTNCYSQHITDKNFAYRNGLQEANFNGKNGKNGNNGAGRLLPTLFNMARRGGNGKPGKPGPTLQVKVAAFPDGDSSILFITITAGKNNTHSYYVNPRYGKLIISANGGDGGNGGDGETGDRTGEKRPYGNSGGAGGNGADGGDGGTIIVTYDSTALPYANCNCIFYNNFGGKGGGSGAGGQASGTVSADGSAGTNGRNGESGPNVLIQGPDKKIIQIK